MQETSAINVSQYVLLGIREEFGWVDIWGLKQSDLDM